MGRRFGYSDELGFGGGPGIAGPLIGGGVTKIGELAAKLLFKSNPGIVKWSGAIGLALGLGVGGVMAARRGTRATGISAMVTAGIVGLPPLIEGVMSGTLKDAGYLGVVTAEEGMLGAEGVQLLDSAGSSGFGVVTAEEQMNGAAGIDLLGSGGSFGTNFWTET